MEGGCRVCIDHYFHSLLSVCWSDPVCTGATKDQQSKLQVHSYWFPPLPCIVDLCEVNKVTTMLNFHRLASQEAAWRGSMQLLASGKVSNMESTSSHFVGEFETDGRNTSKTRAFQ